MDEKYISKIPIDPKITGKTDKPYTSCMAYEYYTLPDTNNNPDKWTCGSSYSQSTTTGAVNIANYSYAIRFSTEQNSFPGFLKFVWNRTPGGKGQEYCVLGHKVR